MGSDDINQFGQGDDEEPKGPYSTDYPEEADIVLIEPFTYERRRKFRRYRANVLDPVLQAVEEKSGRKWRYLNFNEQVGREPEDRADAWRLLHYASLCIADVTDYDYRALAYLSVRLSLSRGAAIALYLEGRRAAWPVHVLPVLFHASEETEEELRQRIEDALSTSSPDGNQRLASPLFGDLPALNVNMRGETKKAGKAPVFEDYRIESLGEASPCLSIAVGDIREVRGVEVWVNPENTAMEMARVYDGSISGTVRHLSADWIEEGVRSNDYIRRALARRTPERRLDPGDAIITPTSGRLRTENGVERVIHVAAVEPRSGNVPGSGYVAVKNIGDCVHNALVELDRENRIRLRRKLTRLIFPLIGTSTSPELAAENVSAMVRALTVYLVNAANQSALRGVALLAYTEEDARHIRRAFEKNDQTLVKAEASLGCWNV